MNHVKQGRSYQTYNSFFKSYLSCLNIGVLKPDNDNKGCSFPSTFPTRIYLTFYGNVYL